MSAIPRGLSLKVYSVESSWFWRITADGDGSTVTDSTHDGEFAFFSSKNGAIEDGNRVFVALRAARGPEISASKIRASGP
jgi:hypothetical protein